MLKDLIKVANRLDSLGHRNEADFLDRLINKLAQEVSSLPISDNILSEELNYVVPVKSQDWNWIMPGSWKLSKENYESSYEQEESLSGIKSGASMAATKIKRLSDELGGDFKASAKRFLELAKESLADYIEFVSNTNDGKRFVEAARRKGGEHLREFTKACDELIDSDRISSKYEVAKDSSSDASPY